MMGNIISSGNPYPYLSGALILLAICVTALLLLPTRRRGTLLSGLLSVPYAFLSPFFVPEYWNPARVATLLAGPEDIIFSFSTGCLAWLLAVWLARRQISLHIDASRLLRRYLACALLGWAVGIPFWLAGFGPMTAALTAITAVGALLVCLRLELWILSLSGAIGFTTVYVVLGAVVFALWPQFLSQWTTGNLCGLALLRMPVEEVAWACAFGGVWPLMMAYGFDARSSRGPVRRSDPPRRDRYCSSAGPAEAT